MFALALLSLATIAGASYQAIAWRADDRRLGRPGRLVSAGEFRLNLYCTGQGSPTAVLESGLQGQQVPPVLLQSKYLKARTSEFENIQVSAEQARTADHIGDKPLVVLTAGRVIDAGLKAALSEEDQMAYEQTWVNDLQVRLALLSKRARRVVVPDSGHDMPSDRAGVIVTAVRELCINQKKPYPRGIDTDGEVFTNRRERTTWKDMYHYRKLSGGRIGSGMPVIQALFTSTPLSQVNTKPVY